MYDDRYKVYEKDTAEFYVNELQRTLHEANETQAERLLEYGMLGSSDVPVFFAPNNKPDLGKRNSPGR